MRHMDWENYKNRIKAMLSFSWKRKCRCRLTLESQHAPGRGEDHPVKQPLCFSCCRQQHFIPRRVCNRPVIKYQSPTLALWAFILNITHNGLFLKKCTLVFHLEANSLWILLQDTQEDSFTCRV